MSPTQRTNNWLKKQGYHSWIVEKWNHHVGIRQDFAGICDIIAVKKNETVCVQSCTTRTAERVRKIEEHKNTPILKEAGWRFLVIGWSKRKVKRGGVAYTYKEKLTWVFEQ